MKIKSTDGRQIVLNEPSSSDWNVKAGDAVVIRLRQSSKYYHLFLTEFTAIVASTKDKQITIKSPVKGSKEKEWAIHINDIECIVRVNEKSNIH